MVAHELANACDSWRSVRTCPGWNSPNCGTCWELDYNGTSINILAIDYAQAGFNIGKTAMDTLTHGQAEQLGVVQVTSKHVANSVCGV